MSLTSIGSLASRMGDIRFVRYVLASAGALAVDFGSFLAMLQVGVAATPAAAGGYSLGMAAHWLLSSRAVFADNAAERGSRRHRQKALFVMSALVGLGLTTLIVAAGQAGGWDPRLAKVLAVGVSFCTTYWLRKQIVFR
ncbi:GtrA family protein [Paraurantiacibacter namhicola]|uniref:GtrA-like protein n=1 Tax=Paraurantiacibacter namhicola TaxID=645517 RepID=A0A1C7D5X7_9SPHN|nr:GtrA family protein [Paraurantiacibacter namhicola]ANU06865.1 GtrA-like protein [Paraurantiacibacter namhicola]